MTFLHSEFPFYRSKHSNWEVWSRTSLQLLSSAPSIFRPTCPSASPSSVLLSFIFSSFCPTSPSSSPPSVLLVLQLLLLPSYCPSASYPRPACPSSSPPSVLLVLQLLLLPSYCPSASYPSVLLVLHLLLLSFYLYFSFSFFLHTCHSSSLPSVLLVLQLLLLPSYLSFIFSSFRSTCPLSSFRPTFLYPSYFPLSNPPICECILHFVLLLVFHHSYSRFSVLLVLYIFLLPSFMFFILHHFRLTFTSSSCSPLLPFLPTSICWLLYCVINLLDV